MPDSIFGIHAKALKAGSSRIGQISSNISNADTPGYKARDYDFRQLVSAGNDNQMKRTHPNHLSKSGESSSLKYRTPLTPRPDQNTVDMDLEKAAFQEATNHYQATLEFIDSKVKTLKSAITGQ